jgi:hypothetical protein
MTTCKACGQTVDTEKPEGWCGVHRYGCVGPSTWVGFLDGYSHGYKTCWCGKDAVIRIHRGLNDRYACSPEHGRSRKTQQTSEQSPFAVFALACSRRS